MLKCWEVDIDSRICFKEIVAELIREDSETHATEGFTKLSSYTAIMITNTALSMRP